MNPIRIQTTNWRIFKDIVRASYASPSPLAPIRFGIIIIIVDVLFFFTVFHFSCCIIKTTNSLAFLMAICSCGEKTTTETFSILLLFFYFTFSMDTKHNVFDISNVFNQLSCVSVKRACFSFSIFPFPFTYTFDCLNIFNCPRFKCTNTFIGDSWNWI